MTSGSDTDNVIRFNQFGYKRSGEMPQRMPAVFLAGAGSAFDDNCEIQVIFGFEILLEFFILSGEGFDSDLNYPPPARFLQESGNGGLGHPG